MTDMIGFIGVGTMGEPMCRNLARKRGATVLAADRNPEPLQRLAPDGVKTASMDEIVASCRTIFLSLPGGKEVEQVCLGEGGLLSQVRMGWTIVDTSTAPVALARRLRRNYMHMMLILLLAWILKLSTPSLIDQAVPPGFVGTLREAVSAAALGPIPGAVIVAVVALLYAGLLAAAFLTPGDDGELSFGDVHV